MDFTAAHPVLARALAAKGYTSPTPVQEAMFAPEIAGRDLLVSAQTGSGKTVAFGLALAAEVYGPDGVLPPPTTPVVLVVAPTRELALQVRRELSWLYAGAKVVSCVGGMSVRMEQRALAAGAHVVVGTPGRLVDHLTQGALDLSGLRALVLDEADEMLDMGFREELEGILGAAPSERRTLFFSATLPAGIERLSATFLTDPLRIAASPPAQAHADIEYRAVTVLPHEREAAIVNLLRYLDVGALVFAATREGVEHLRARLVERGFAAVALSGDLTQAERNRALDALRGGRARVLVATDVAARGLDLPDLGVVIQADLPLDAAVFQHRCGRTGRAGRKGTAVALVPPARRRLADRLFREAGVTPTWSRVPTVEAIEALDRERIKTTVGELAEEIGDTDRAAAAGLIEVHGAEGVAAILHHLLQERLPSPEELPETIAFLERLNAPRVQPRPERPGSPERFQRGERPTYGERRAERPGFAARPGPADRPSFAERPAPAERPSFAERPPPADRPSFAERAGHADRASEVPTYERPPRGDRPPGGDRPPRRGPPGAGGVWFRLSVGRAQNADPRWLIPMLCNRGQIVKADIGAIRIGEDETRVEINPAVAARFAALSARPTGRGPRIDIRRLPGE